MEMRYLYLALAVSLIVACGPEEEAPSPTPVEVFTLSLDLVDGPFEAGVAYPYEVTLEGSIQGAVPGVASLKAFPEEGVRITETTLTFEIARDYNLSFESTFEGTTYGDSRAATTLPGPSSALEISLSDNDIRAGEVITVAGALKDAFGNITDPDPALALTLTPQDGVQIASPTFTLTLAGDYSLEARYTPLDLRASLDLRANPGPGVALTLTPSSLNIGPGEPITVAATLADAYGNTTEVTPTLSTEPATGVRINGDRIIFSEEGYFDISGRHDGESGQVTGEGGTAIVDGTAPLLTVTKPLRGSYQEDQTLLIEGEVEDSIAGVSSLNIMGSAITLGEDGSFSHEITLSPGLNTLTFEAFDNNGNLKEGVRSVLHAEAFAPMGAPLEEAFYGRLGQESIDDLSLLLEDELSLETMSEWLYEYNPIEAYNETTTVLGKEYTTSAFITLEELRYSEVVVELIANEDSGDGYLELSVTFNDLGATLEAYGELANDPYNLCGDLQTEFSLATAKTRATFNEEGRAQVDLDDVIVSLADFEIRMCDDSLQALLSLIEEEVQEELEDLLKDLIIDEIPSELESLIDSLILSEDFELEGVPMHLDAALSGMRFDDDGATLWMWSSLTTEALPDLPPNLGVPLTPSRAPSYDNTHSLYISANDDLLNQLFYTLWAAGTLHLEYDAEDLGLTSEQIGLLFDGATVARFRMVPPLPPVLQYTSTDGYLMDAALGDCAIDVLTDATTGDPNNLTLDYALAATAVAPATAFAPSPNILAVEIGTPELLMVEIVNNIAGLPIAEDTLNLVLSTAVGALLDDLNASMAEVPIPAIEGYALEVHGIYMDGPEGDYLTLGGDLIAPGDWEP